MTETIGLPYGGPGIMHIDYDATLSCRMPTDHEVARGYAADAPVLVVTRRLPPGVTPALPALPPLVLPHYIELTVDAPHARPEPTETNRAVRYVLGVVAEELGLAAARVGDLMEAVNGSCDASHLADAVREERDDAWGCADQSVCGTTTPVDPALTR